MTSPILYSFRRCPYAIRTRMALAYSKIDYEHREILLKDKPAAMLAISAKGTVPVFQLSNGQVIDESLDIICWSLTQNDPKNWFCCLDKELKAQINDLININDNKFKKNLDQYKYASRYPENPPEYYRQQAEVFLLDLEDKLNKNTFLLSAEMTLADIAIFPFIRQFSLVEPIWFEQSNYQDLHRWLSRLIKSDLFNTIMQKHPIWKTSNIDKSARLS